VLRVRSQLFLGASDESNLGPNGVGCRGDDAFPKFIARLGQGVSEGAPLLAVSRGTLPVITGCSGPAPAAQSATMRPKSMHASASALMTTTARAIARDTEAVLRPMTAITVPVSFGFGADALGASPVYASPSGREPPKRSASVRSEIGLVSRTRSAERRDGLSVT
jgi:hypothetical protein